MDNLYLLSENFNNITYSIDMLRVRCKISYTFFTEIEFRFETCWKHYVEKKWNSTKYEDYNYNYTINVDGNIIYFGFLHNTERRSQSEIVGYRFVVEFNPNKVRHNEILDYILSVSQDWYLKSCDLAMDLPVSILDIVWDKGLKRNYKIFGSGYDDKTIEIGKGQGRLKIYNKKRESNLNILSELTRVEVSAQFEDFQLKMIKLLEFPDIFPTLYTSNHMFTFEDYTDKTLLACVYAVQMGFAINDLSRVYKKKVSQMLEGGDKIKFSRSNATSVLRRTLFNYFLYINHFS